MNFINAFEELNKLYESPETLTEGKILDNLKKVATRLGADAATIVRAFSELLPGDKAYEAAVNAENKAVLKALQSGNERVLNTLTIDDIEELKKDIEDYAKSKVYFDGSHYIAIPHINQPWKKRKHNKDILQKEKNVEEKKKTKKEIFEETYKENLNKNKKEKMEKLKKMVEEKMY